MDSIGELLERKGREVWSVGPDQTVREAIQIMADRSAGALAVVEEGQLVGILSERDYTRKIALQGRSSKDTRVREIMTLRVIYAQLEQSIEDCMAIMNKHDIRHMPVLDDEKLVGMLSLKDLVTVIIEKQQTLIEELETYIMG